MANFLRSCIWSHHGSLVRSGIMSRNLFVSAGLHQDQIQPKPATPPTSGTAPESSRSSMHSLHAMHKPTDMEKKLLVWTKKYKTTEDVPATVSREEMEKCRSRVRIKVSNILIALTIVGCGIMIYSGKQAAERGETIQQMNLDWHKQYNQVTASGEATAAAPPSK